MWQITKIVTTSFERVGFGREFPAGICTTMTAVREAGVSRHDGGLVKPPPLPETPRQ